VLHMTKQKQLKIMKSTLAVLLAGSVTFSGTSAFANSDSESFETVNIDQKETDSTTNVQVNDEANIDSVKEEIEKLEDSTEAPSLLPGDFFYFAKLALEKVKLAFTMDDSKEAKLLAEYAAERLAEAEALFQAGQEEEAIEAINKAIEMMNSFEDKWSDDEVTEEDSSSDESNEGTEEDAAPEEGKTEEDTTTDENTDTDVDTDETTETEEDTTTEEPADTEETTDETTSEDKETEEMKELMSQNIVALSAALEKVKNPKAKAALQKNIEKSYAKLAEKLAKFEDKWAKEEEEKEEVTETPEKDTTEAPTEETTTEETPVEGQPVEEETETAPVPVKTQEKQEVKEERKANQQQAKEEREERKQEAKEQRDAVKEERKQAKEDRKENNSQTDKHDNNAHGNGNGQQKGNGHKGNGNN
jgi:tetratricopeptide (TPR) repeat protein